MGLEIKDGTGSGSLAKVDNSNRLATSSIVQTENHRINREGNAYVVYADITPTGAGDTFMYIKNTSNDSDMIINWYRIWSGTNADAIDIYLNEEGTPAGTTVITPVNSNAGSSNQADGEFYEGVNITGLSGGLLFDRLRLAGNGEDVLGEYPGDIVLKKGNVLTLRALTGTFPLEVTLSFFYDNITNV